jgi:hypothetical protein
MTMTDEPDHNLSFDAWEALKALRPFGLSAPKVSSHILQQLVADELVVILQAGPVITPKGRSVVLRGSPRLWDLAA